jgi:hypothetical protein
MHELSILVAKMHGFEMSYSFSFTMAARLISASRSKRRSRLLNVPLIIICCQLAHTTPGFCHRLICRGWCSASRFPPSSLDVFQCDSKTFARRLK